MDRLKKFFKDSKTKKNFKKAGQGRRLIDGAPVGSGVPKNYGNSAGRQQVFSAKGESLSTERIASADFAAQAAYKRMNLGVKQETATQRNIRLQALKELEKEKLRESGGDMRAEQCAQGAASHTIDERSFDHSDAIKNVYFTCELLGEDVKLTKDELRELLEEFLRSQLEDDAVVASSLMIFSLNNAKQQQLASETLQKYVQNLVEHPGEPKFRRIRMSNKAFQERIMAVKGGLEFLLGCGFEESYERNDENSAPEKYLVISEGKANDVPALVQALEVLRSAEPVPIKLHRDPAIYKADNSKKVADAEFSSDFYQLTLDEVKAEQAAKSLQAQRMLTLRTKEMRLHDETLRHYTYKYTLIRIRFPDEYFLQGTFGCFEKLVAVREFITKFIVSLEVSLFILKDAATGKLVDDDTKSLEELNLTPAALLNFEWDADILASYMAQGIPMYKSESEAAMHSEAFIVAANHASADSEKERRDYTGPSPVLERVRSFLPKIASANVDLPASSTISEFSIVRLDSSSEDPIDQRNRPESVSSDDTEDEEPYVEMDLSLLKEENSFTSSSSSSSNEDEISGSDKDNALPKAFQSRRHKGKRRLIEEVEESG